MISTPGRDQRESGPGTPCSLGEHAYSHNGVLHFCSHQILIRRKGAILGEFHLEFDHLTQHLHINWGHLQRRESKQANLDSSPPVKHSWGPVG